MSSARTDSKITQQDANELLKKYQTQLENLQIFMDRQYTHFLRSDLQYIPNILSALDAIANNKPFNPSVATSGMSSIKDLPENPHDCVNALINDPSFIAMLDFYSANHKLDASLKSTVIEFQKIVKAKFPVEQIQEEPQVILYKSKNGELAVKFPDEQTANNFLEQLGGIKTFGASDPHNPGKKCPARFDDNPTTLYFPAYTAKNGEFTGVFASKEMREKFYNIIIKDPHNQSTGSKFEDPGSSPHLTPVTTDNNVMYFHSKNFFKPGGNISIPVSGDLKEAPAHRVKY